MVDNFLASLIASKQATWIGIARKLGLSIAAPGLDWLVMEATTYVTLWPSYYPWMLPTKRRLAR